MPLPGRLSWPLVVSLCAHGALAATFVATRSTPPATADTRPPDRDVWIGETLETPEPTRDAPSPPAPAAPEPASFSAAAPHATKSAPLRAEPKPVVVERAAPEEPLDALAARILAYAPKSAGSNAGTESTDDGAARDRTRGGMDGAKEDAPARSFAKAFTRALPAANSGDPIWNALALGVVGSVRIAVTVDEEGTISQSTVLELPHKPPVALARLAERTILLLRGGRFALTKAGKGTETLRIDVTLSERPSANGPLALGFEPPSPGSPGRAYFQLSTGRFVDAKVAIEREGN